MRDFLYSKLREVKCRLKHPAWWRQYQESLAHDKWSVEQLAEYNWQKRLAILAFAYENSPYYGKLYRDVGLEPGDVKTEEDWQNVPMLTREALRENFETLKIRGVERRGRYKMWTTGGSTGQPSKVLKDDDFSSSALNWRAGEWAGIRPGGNSATIMRTHPMNWKGKLRHFAATFPNVNLMLDAGSMTEESIERFLAQWRKYKPRTISSYVGGVHQLALYCLERNIKLPSPEAISTTAAPLPAATRHTISAAFHCPVFDNYVATEAHPMANQCRELATGGTGYLHIHSDYRHLEFADENGLCVPAEEFGDTLVTDLEDRVFPIVRYRIGDRGRMMNYKCSCGRPYPVMDAVHGRSFDFIYLEHGRIMGECWATAFDDCLNAVHNFQIHQAADKSVTLKVVMNRDYPEAKKCIEKVAADLQSQLGRIPLRLEYMDFIPHNRGKIKYIISDVNEACSRM